MLVWINIQPTQISLVKMCSLRCKYCNPCNEVFAKYVSTQTSTLPNILCLTQAPCPFYKVSKCQLPLMKLLHLKRREIKLVLLRLTINWKKCGTLTIQQFQNVMNAFSTDKLPSYNVVNVDVIAKYLISNSRQIFYIVIKVIIKL